MPQRGFRCSRTPLGTVASFRPFAFGLKALEVSPSSLLPGADSASSFIDDDCAGRNIPDAWLEEQGKTKGSSRGQDHLRRATAERAPIR